MGKLSDEILMAFADGELDMNERDAVSAAVHADPELQNRLAVFVETQEQMVGIFDAPMHMPPPDGLIDVILGDAPAMATASSPELVSSKPVSNAGAWQERATAFLQGLVPGTGSLGSAGLALGLTLLVGGAIGWQMNAQDEAANPAGIGALAFEYNNGRLVARDGFKLALNTAPTGGQVSLTGVAGQGVTLYPVATFRSVKNEFCRQYDVMMTSSRGAANAKSFSGVACRSKEGNWNIPVHVATALRLHDNGAIRPSAGGDSRVVIDRFVDQLIEGDVLDVADEAKLIEQKWKTAQ